MDIYTLIDIILQSQLTDDIVHFSYVFTLISAFVFTMYAIFNRGEWIYNGGLTNLLKKYEIERQNYIALEIVNTIESSCAERVEEDNIKIITLAQQIKDFRVLEDELKEKVIGILRNVGCYYLNATFLDRF